MKLVFDFKDIKLYITIYTIIILSFSIFFFNFTDFSHTSFKIAMIILLIVIGAISLIFYKYNIEKMHKVAFVIILLFGITMVFLTPITDASDEIEHFIRSDIVSTGQISTDYIAIPNSTENGYQTIATTIIFANATGMTVFDTNVDDSPINHTPDYFNSAFSQNPFYAYLTQAIGVFLAKLLDLNAIWMLWLSRLCNILLYAIIIAFAIKKAPTFKLPLLIVAISPISILLAASNNTDGLFTALALLAFAYFLHFCENNNIEWKDLLIFFASIILCGLLKAPYLALSLLVFLIPNENFKDKRQNITSKISIIAVLLLGLIWSGYATNELLHSWRGLHMSEKHVNSTEQLSYLFSSPIVFGDKIIRLFTELPIIIDRYFFFPDAGRVQFSKFFATIYSVFILAFSFLYPLEKKITKNNRIKGFLIAFLIYGSVVFVQYLTWSSVGAAKITAGVYGRYFTPLIIFLPFIFGNTHTNYDKDKISFIALVIAMGITAGVMIMTLFIKY